VLAATVPSLMTYLAAVPDFRQARGKRHSLAAILALACVAMLCGARSEAAIAEWAANYGAPWRRRLGLTHPTGPSQATIHRVFKGLDHDALEQCVGAWAQHVLRAIPADDPQVLEAIAIDGKTLRGSVKAGAPHGHLLSALSQRLGLVLAQVAVPEKTNEIGAFDAVLAEIVLDGTLVTTDALLTQRRFAHTILERGGQYLLEVKENQPATLAAITVLFTDPAAATSAATSLGLHGNRVERRTLRASTELVGYLEWPGLAQVLCLERSVTDKRSGMIRHETAYAITSLGPERASPAHLLTAWRAHWHIENRLHYVRDVTFDEDRSQVRTGAIPQVMATLRNTAIGLLRLDQQTNIAAACRRYAAQPALALAAVGLT
jgi:predicted transposase YbfD/YdcC